MKISFDILTDYARKEFWAALALRHCEHMTPRLLRNALVYYGSAYATFCSVTRQKTLTLDFPKKLIPKAIISALRQEKWRIGAHNEWRLSKNFHGEIILWTDYRYPLGLKQIIDAPPFLYVRGDTSLLASPSVAIVGSRKYHPDTLEKTYTIAHDLSACGICVISGLAKGIDFAAHSGALKQIGKTIAVLGCGADVVYPLEHSKLYDEIRENGLIISEFAPQTKPLAQNFPIRNRIVSGLSEAVLVAEAAPRSGSLITARLALEQNRSVYVLKPMSENHSLGCHALIQDGAVQVDDALSIIADIAPNLQGKFIVNESYIASSERFIIPSSVTKTEVLQKKQTSQTKQAVQIVQTEETGQILQTKITTRKTIIKKGSITNTIVGNKAAISQDTIISKGVIRKTKVESPRKPKHAEELNLAKQDITNTMYPAEAVRKRPKLDNALPILDVDFANLAGELMGEVRSYNATDILSHRPKKKKEKTARKHMAEKNFNDFGNIALTENKSHTEKSGHNISKDRSSLSELEKNILNIIDTQKALVPDEILVKLPPNMQDISTLSAALLMLEVEEYLMRLSGNRYQNL